MSWLLKLTELINDVVLGLVGLINYIDQLLNDVKMFFINILVFLHRNIDKYQKENPEGFVLLASVGIIFCFISMFFILNYKITEDAKYKKTHENHPKGE